MNQLSAKGAATLFSQGKYADALEMYKRLSQRYGAGLFAANIALCEKRIGSAAPVPLPLRRSIIFVSDHVYLPHRAGGRESSINDLATMFAAKGWRVAVVAQRPRLNTDDPVRATLFPYQVIEVEDVFKSIVGLSLWLEADEIVASVDGKNIKKFLHHFPAGSCLFVRDNQGLEVLTESDKDHFVFVANSNFTAKEVERRIKHPVPWFPPLIDLDRYRTSTTGEFVTFINPVPKKGLHIALDIARHMPDVNFLFCEGWPLSDQQWDELKTRVADLGNVKLERFTHQMASIYRRTKLLLVPSQWEEAWGRVVTEAQASGIPVIVNDVGGLRESCGIGGVVMPRTAQAIDWADTIRNLLNNAPRYRQLSQDAVAQSSAYAELTKRYIDNFLLALAKRTHHGKSAKHSVTEILEGAAAGKTPAHSYVVIGTREGIDATSLFRHFYRQKLYADAIDVYRRHSEEIKKTADFVLSLAIAYSGIRKYEDAIACWETCFSNSRRKPTVYQAKTYADCLSAVGRHHDALTWYLRALNDDPGQRGLLEKALICFARQGAPSAFDALDKYIRASDDPRERAKYLSLAHMGIGDISRAAQYYRTYIEGEGKPSVTEYSFGVYLALRLNNIEWALELSARAVEVFPTAYKGPSDAYLRDASTDLETPVLGGKLDDNAVPSTGRSPPEFVCSWPGTLAGNRFMDSVRAAFSEAGLGFLPIDMPSTCVIRNAKALIIQWPDVLRWRNRHARDDQLYAKMFEELAALKQWKACGVRIIWLVHNSLPHDVKQDSGEEVAWRTFFDLLGSTVDKVVTLYSSGEKVVKHAIPSTADKRFDFFYHPPYSIRRFAQEEIQAKRSALGLDAQKRLYAVLGSIGSYKGLGDLIQSFLKVSDPNARLLIAGRARDQVESEEVRRAIGDSVAITFMEGFVPEEEFDLLANCADAIIVPNKRYLNSGALIYAISANKPILALAHPFAGEMAGLVDHDNAMCLVDSFASEDAVRFFSGDIRRECEYVVSRLQMRPIVDALLS